jgi:ribulose-5-phosphate 4-epimerase/fuculose-1-phosphate aldolase
MNTYDPDSAHALLAVQIASMEYRITQIGMDLASDKELRVFHGLLAMEEQVKRAFEMFEELREAKSIHSLEKAFIGPEAKR